MTTNEVCRCAECPEVNDMVAKLRKISDEHGPVLPGAPKLIDEVAAIVARLTPDAKLGANLRKVVESYDEGVEVYAFRRVNSPDPSQLLFAVIDIDTSSSLAEADTLDAAPQRAAEKAEAEL